MTPLAHILLGAVIMGDVLAALFFVRFWKMTGDRFFLFFSASFLAIAVSRVVVDESIPPFGMEAFGYLIRILSYLFIIAGILYKNRGTKTSRTLAPPSTVFPQEHLS
ncbi:MAG: conserved rane protein of unknown function [Nitrospira sp.]|jgi:hypothetical protein|nr:conserved rane protein of unknown function [Nitrospira sp.]